MTRQEQPPPSDHVLVLAEVADEHDAMPYHPGRRLDRALAAAHLAGISPTAITIRLDPDGAATGIAIDTAPGISTYAAGILADFLGATSVTSLSSEPDQRAQVASASSDLDVSLTITADPDPATLHAASSNDHASSEYPGAGDGDAQVIQLSDFRARYQSDAHAHEDAGAVAVDDDGWGS